jgi:hypothetical protein
LFASRTGVAPPAPQPSRRRRGSDVTDLYQDRLEMKMIFNMQMIMIFNFK